MQGPSPACKCGFRDGFGDTFENEMDEFLAALKKEGDALARIVYARLCNAPCVSVNLETREREYRCVTVPRIREVAESQCRWTWVCCFGFTCARVFTLFRRTGFEDHLVIDFYQFGIVDTRDATVVARWPASTQ